MLRRFIAIFVLVQQVAWLLVILPGHQRGAMAIAGTNTSDVSTKDGACAVVQKQHACCDSNSGQTADSGNGKSKKSEDPLKKLSHCAVCHVAVRLTPAPPPDFVPSPTGLVAQLLPTGPGAIASLTALPTYDATGPPVLA